MKKEIIKEKKDETKSVDTPSKVVSDKVEAPSEVVASKVVSDKVETPSKVVSDNAVLNVDDPRGKQLEDLLYKKISDYCKKNICSIVDDHKISDGTLRAVSRTMVPYKICMGNCDPIVLDNFITNCAIEALDDIQGQLNMHIIDNINENMIVPISFNNEPFVFSDKIQKAKEKLIASGFDENKTQFLLHMAPSTMNMWRESSDDTENYSIHNGFLTFVDRKLHKQNVHKIIRQNLPYEQPINTYAVYYAQNAVKASIKVNSRVLDEKSECFIFDLIFYVHDVNKKGCGYIES